MPTAFIPQLPEPIAGLRVALSHDWLTGMRGGERVLELLCAAFPEAQILTLVHNPSAISPAINGHAVRTSFLQRIPGIEKSYRRFLPLFPIAVERMPVPPSDIVISTSHCVAKGVISPKGARHLCCCFTPMRYAWTFYEEYFGRNLLKRMVLNPLLADLRRWDRRTADRVDHFVAISRHVQARIKACYGRDSDVVYPPVDTAWWTPGMEAPRAFDLIVSALVPYKRIDLAIEAYGRLGWPLKIVGVGTELARLKTAAKSNVEFLGWLPDESVRDLYRSCRLLVFPGEEDFGLVPLEAQACGKPVVAFARGGALESVQEGLSGRFFQEQTTDSLLGAVEEASAARWSAPAIRRHAEQFDIPSFWGAFASAIQKCLKTR